MHLLNGLLLGLSTGLFCLGHCLPVFGPLVLAESRSIKGHFIFLAKFTLGRFLAYCLLGVLVAYLGLKIESQILHQIVWLGLVFLGGLMIIYALGLMRPVLLCGRCIQKIKMPWLAGFLIGLQICPPFLMALSYSFNLRQILAGLLFFIMYFIGNSLYFIPATFLGFLSKYQALRQMARLAAWLVGVIFIGYGVVNLI